MYIVSFFQDLPKQVEAIDFILQDSVYLFTDGKSTVAAFPANSVSGVIWDATRDYKDDMSEDPDWDDEEDNYVSPLSEEEKLRFELMNNAVASVYSKGLADTLKQQTPLDKIFDRKPLPVYTGNEIKFFQYQMNAINDASQGYTSGTSDVPLSETGKAYAQVLADEAEYIAGIKKGLPELKICQPADPFRKVSNTIAHYTTGEQIATSGYVQTVGVHTDTQSRQNIAGRQEGTNVCSQLGLPMEPGVAYKPYSEKLPIDREELATYYVEKSGKTRHMMDCATSCAPAYVPGPCDCDAPRDDLKFSKDPITGVCSIDSSHYVPFVDWKAGFGLLQAAQQKQPTLAELLNIVDEAQARVDERFAEITARMKQESESKAALDELVNEKY